MRDRDTSMLRRKGARPALAILALAVFALTAIAQGAVTSEHGVKVSIIGQLKPFGLPRQSTAPIAMFLSGHVASAKKGKLPPQLAKLEIELNKHGRLESKGLPSCRLVELQPASTQRALENCGDAVVGSGKFWATVVLPGQDPYPTRGRLLVFNGRKKGRHVVFAHIFTENPFFNSFVITFSIHRIHSGPYGTKLTASLPQALGSWGYVDRIKLTLKRFYRSHGQRRSFFNAGCPAPKGFTSVVFPLARVHFAFAGGQTLHTVLTKNCKVKE